MRSPLHPPTEELTADQLADMRTYFDGQSRIDLVVWVAHEHRTESGPDVDHHLLLGLDDEAYAELDVAAIAFGIEQEAPLAGWVDLYPLSEVEDVREIGTVVWERDAPPAAGLDPLDFHYTYEAVETPRDLVASVRWAVEDEPSVRRVELSRERLRKGELEVFTAFREYVLYDEAGTPGRSVNRLSDVLGEFVTGNMGVGAGHSLDARVIATTAYERAAEEGRT